MADFAMSDAAIQRFKVFWIATRRAELAVAMTIMHALQRASEQLHYFLLSASICLISLSRILFLLKSIPSALSIFSIISSR